VLFVLFVVICRGAKMELSLKTHPLSDSERRAWLRLARAQNVGPVTFAALIERFHSASAALRELPRLSRRGGAAGDLRVPDEDEATRELEMLQRAGGRLIASIEPDFPTGLVALEAPPPLISALGRHEILSREMVAVVGARNASALGRKFATELAADLGRAGLAVVSGLARGIDTAAHEGALATGTIAVLAGGVDDIYPPENARLYARIMDIGAVVSEMPIGQKPQAKHFPRRNRIISGLARGVVVVEAAEGSGSLITANFALEQGREVFAVPGSPLDPRARGTNRLLRDGAALTEGAGDVLDVLQPLIGRAFREPAVGSIAWGTVADDLVETRLREKIEELLGPAPILVNELVRQCAAPAAAVLSILIELELAGRLHRESGDRVSLG
jgi:DNA processing protein